MRLMTWRALFISPYLRTGTGAGAGAREFNDVLDVAAQVKIESKV
jgi:hypothetical protein